MQDTTLLQLITDDIAPTQHLLEILKAESLALHGRDMVEMEHILAQKQALVIVLEQHGRRRSQLLASLGLPTNRAGL
ncbi:MAG TPA: flagellar export chaperone FlgN, partial [Pseudomonas sp.]|nr:flagellar export chaperone FlgN [Pseudomonas sp.]